MSSFVKILSDFGSVKGKFFGPFESGEQAAEYLMNSGWTLNINNLDEERDIWSCRTYRFESVTARILPLMPVSQCPKNWIDTKVA